MAALPPISSMIPFVTVVALRGSLGLLSLKSKRKALNGPNQMQGAAHTATTQPHVRYNSDSNVANHVN